MVVPLKATTVKLAVLRNRTDTSKGWTTIIGGGPRAAQGLASSKPASSSHLAVFLTRQLNFSMVLIRDIELQNS